MQNFHTYRHIEVSRAQRMAELVNRRCQDQRNGDADADRKDDARIRRAGGLVCFLLILADDIIGNRVGETSSQVLYK